MSEYELQERVFALLRERPALLWHHCADARRCKGQHGFPDLVVAGRGGVLFRELKGENTRLRLFQMAFGRQLPGWKVWRPADLESGLIVRELDAII